MALTLEPLPAWLALDERKSPRWPMDLSASLRSPVDIEVPVRLADISTHGCLLTLRGGSTVGRYVGVAVPTFGVLEGWIAWSSGDHAGMDFSHPLPPEVVSAIIALSPPADKAA